MCPVCLWSRLCWDDATRQLCFTQSTSRGSLVPEVFVPTPFFGRENLAVCKTLQQRRALVHWLLGLHELARRPSMHHPSAGARWTPGKWSHLQPSRSTKRRRLTDRPWSWWQTNSVLLMKFGSSTGFSLCRYPSDGEISFGSHSGFYTRWLSWFPKLLQVLVSFICHCYFTAPFSWRFQPPCLQTICVLLSRTIATARPSCDEARALSFSCLFLPIGFFLRQTLVSPTF